MPRARRTRSIASPTVLRSLTSSPLELDAELVLDDLRELDEVERVDVERPRSVASRLTSSAVGAELDERLDDPVLDLLCGDCCRDMRSPCLVCCSGGQAAVDGQRGSGHVGGLVGGEEARRRRRPPRGCRRGGPGSRSSSSPPTPSVMSVSIRPGATALTVTPRRATSAATRLGEADQAGLRGRVVGLAGVGPQADDRGDVDDAPEAGAQHRPQRAAGEPEGGGEVGVEHARPSRRRRAAATSPSARTPALLTSTSTGPKRLLEPRRTAASAAVGVGDVGLARRARVPPAASISRDDSRGARPRRRGS